jgi:hypothetical protein
MRRIQDSGRNLADLATMSHFFDGMTITINLVGQGLGRLSPGVHVFLKFRTKLALLQKKQGRTWAIYTTRSRKMSHSARNKRRRLGTASKYLQLYRMYRNRRKRNPRKPFKCSRKNGRGERIRTSDPLVPNQVLYQAEPLPELAISRTLTDPKSSWRTLRTRP